MDVSFIIPSRNEGDKLRRTVESIQETVTNCRYEILVVDNGSDDESADFLKNERESRFADVRFFHFPDFLGVAPARNLGAALARGKYIAFVDAHVWFYPNWLPALIEELSRPGVAVVGPAIGYWDRPEVRGYGQRWSDPSLTTEWLSPPTLERPFDVPAVIGCMNIWKREVFFHLGAYDPWMRLWGNEDIEICMRAWTFGWECRLVPTVQANHFFRRKHPYSVNWEPVLFNAMRSAHSHFNSERIRRCEEGFWKEKGEAYQTALAALAASDIRERREQFARRRVRDDDWYWERFGLRF